MPDTSLERATAVEHARWFQALADPTRILIMRFVSRHALPVPAGAIVDHLQLSQSTVSHHLKILHRVRFLTRRRSGTHILYTVNRRCITELPAAADVLFGAPASPVPLPDGHPAPTPRPAMDTTRPASADAPVLLLVGSGDRRYREYIVDAVSRHFRLWLLDAHEATWQLPYVQGTTVCDTKDPELLEQAASPVVADLPVAGVFTYDESLVHAAAHLAQRLGLPGSPPEAVLACRDKATTRRMLTDAQIPQPASVPVTTADEAVTAADSIGYPVVVKARGLGGSIGVVRAEDATTVRQAFAEASSAAYPGVPRYEADVLIEEFLTGEEISIDAVVVDGVCTPLVVAHKQTGLAPYFEETGHLVDAADPLLEDTALLDQLDRIHKTLGFVRGATHTEFKLTPDGPRLVEINARLGGDFIPRLGALATGCDPSVAAAQVAAGVSPHTTPTRRRTAGIRFLYPPGDCTAEDVTVRTDRFGPTIHTAVATAGAGTRLALPPRAYLNRYGYVIAVGDAEQVATDLADPTALIELRTQAADD